MGQSYEKDSTTLFDSADASFWLLRVLNLTHELFLVPLQEPFGTFNLLLADWALVGALAFTVMPVLEGVKWMERRGWFGKLV